MRKLVDETVPDAEEEYDRLGITPTPPPTERYSTTVPWDESTRPHRSRSAPDVTYTARGRSAGQLLIDVHDGLRTELAELQDILTQVRVGAVSAAGARAALNEMALRRNDWTLGTYCARYCRVVTMHHQIEDTSVFPSLTRREPELVPVVDRLVDEHRVIHDAIQAVDRALVDHINRPEGGFAGITSTLDYLADALLSHLAYEEHEVVEPLARLGL